MSLSVVYTRASIGIEAPLVTVETHISSGLPALAIVGLPEKAVKESKDRVRSALINSGYDFPNRRITINLAPADLPKQGGRYDLAIAMGILAASNQLNFKALDSKEFLGELALTGEIRPVTGVIPAALSADQSGRHIIVPKANQSEASLLRTELSICAHLNELVQHLNLGNELENPVFEDVLAGEPLPDLSDVIGQHRARRAIELAAAGELNLLLYGPPGTGKSMLAQRLRSVLPPLSHQEMLEVVSLKSSVDAATSEALREERPFRSPHHSSTAISMVGGGAHPVPGEVSMAHRGVLFLDELPEFGRQVLEVLREPIESGEIHISRANYRTRFPANFQLVAAMNPCPCGYQGHPKIECSDSPADIQRYRRKLSGPLLDRFDLHVEVNYQSPEILLSAGTAPESSDQVLQRVMRAREIQFQRQGKPNARLSVSETETFCVLNNVLRNKLATAIEKLQLSARSLHRIKRVARTLADLRGEEDIEMRDISEALSYRMMDRKIS